MHLYVFIFLIHASPLYLELVIFVISKATEHRDFASILFFRLSQTL